MKPLLFLLFDRIWKLLIMPTISLFTSEFKPHNTVSYFPVLVTIVFLVLSFPVSLSASDASLKSEIDALNLEFGWRTVEPNIAYINYIKKIVSTIPIGDIKARSISNDQEERREAYVRNLKTLVGYSPCSEDFFLAIDTATDEILKYISLSDDSRTLILDGTSVFLEEMFDKKAFDVFVRWAY
jgi:hypothetical protein